ncbi:MAG: DUF5723 family protein [Bacteroidota bacterium]
MRFATICAIGLCLLTLPLSAQEQAAFRMLPTAGINRISLNPAFAATGTNRWDVNVVEGSAFFANNYLYFQNTNTIELLQHLNDEGELQQFDLEAPPAKPGEEPIIFDYYRGTETRFSQLQTNFMGPSVAFKIGEQHTIGVFNRFRTQIGTADIPANFSYYTYYDRPFEEQFSVEPFLGAALSWLEIGLNYSIALPTEQGQLRLGISPKWLRGYYGAYVKNNSTFQLEKLPGDSLRSGPLDLEFGYTESLTDDGDVNFDSGGSGWGVDLGVEYLFGAPEAPWSIGFSILDLGQISFDENAARHRLAQADPLTIIGFNDYDDFGSLDDLDMLVEQFSTDVLGDSTASLASNSFSMGLPTAASLQVKKDFTSTLAVAMTYTHPMRVFANSPSRIENLSILPMYSTRWFGVVLPVSVYNWEQVRVGAHLQLAWLHLGTENLLSFVGKGEYNSSDAYVALKVQPFRSRSDRDQGELRRRKKRSSETGCYFGF